MKKVLPLSIIILSVGCSMLSIAQAAELPVFRVETGMFDEQKATALFDQAFQTKAKAEQHSLRSTVIVLQEGERKLEFDQRSGHWYATDKAKRWTSRVDGKVPERQEAAEIATKFVDQTDFLPSDKWVEFKQIALTETAIGDDRGGSVDKRILDYTATWGASIPIEGEPIPVVGGGGEIAVTVGVDGDVISFMGGWRSIAEKVDSVDVGTQDEAVEQFIKNSSNIEYKDVKARLAYYAAPAFEKQEFLAPVWVISGEMLNGKEVVPIRSQIVATSLYGPVWKPGDDPKYRSKHDLSPGLAQSDEESQKVFSLLDMIISPAFAASNPECGASWIGTSQGLSGSSGNRQGFLDECRGASLPVNFDWGNEAAFESDWRRNDDSYVDAADLVFYTGHASQNGWNMFNPDDTFLHYSEVSGASDLWGQSDLEWFIIAACGPLQSNHFMGNTTNAFDRWRDSFDGLHAMLAYGAVTYDNTEEGGRFMELALGGEDVIDAWFRTAQEIQPATNGSSAPNGPDIYVVAMYAHDGDYCTENDHLHGYGSVCPDVRGSAQRRTMMWSGT
ncbi:MAG: DUF6345 domain-containing protein [Methylococcaceae bacterium]